MRLADINGIEQANTRLESSGYLAKLDGRFGIAAADPIDGHRPLVLALALSDVQSEKESRRGGVGSVSTGR